MFLDMKIHVCDILEVGILTWDMILTLYDPQPLKSSKCHIFTIPCKTMKNMNFTDFDNVGHVVWNP